MNEPLPWRTRTAGALAASSIRSWMRTLDYRLDLVDPQVDPALPASRPRIYVFWHEYLLMPLYLRANCNLAMLVSKHRDADILACMGAKLGFECVRGSTYNGAASALREMTRRGRTTHLAITPDGPRGPRRQLAQGAVFLASKLQLPIVATGMAYDRPWRAKSWDRFAVPRPFSRARLVVSEEIVVPKGLSRSALEEHRQSIEARLNGLTESAEAWAFDGNERPGEVRGDRARLKQAA